MKTTQNQDSIFNCHFCLGEYDDNLDIKKQAVFIEEQRSFHNKISLKIPISHTQTNLIHSEKTIIKSNHSRCSLLKKSDSIPPVGLFHKTDSNYCSNTQLPQSIKYLPKSGFQPNNSLQSTNSTSFLPIKSPKVTFSYGSIIPKTPINQSIINIDAQFESFPQLEMPHKISQIQRHSESSEPIGSDFNTPQGSSTSPLNKLYRASHNQIIVSKELKKKSSNSFESSKKLKRLSSLNEPFGKSKMKIRQTESIREPEDESDLFSVVITNSLMGSNMGGLLLPIDENEYETKFSNYRQ